MHLNSCILFCFISDSFDACFFLFYLFLTKFSEDYKPLCDFCWTAHLCFGLSCLKKWISNKKLKIKFCQVGKSRTTSTRSAEERRCLRIIFFCHSFYYNLTFFIWLSGNPSKVTAPFNLFKFWSFRAIDFDKVAWMLSSAETKLIRDALMCTK